MKKKDFDNLLTSIKQAGKIRRGEISPGRIFKYDEENIKAIRAKLHKSQTEFAALLGVSVSTIQNWEQGRRKPDGSARILLRIASKNPEILEQVIYT